MDYMTKPLSRSDIRKLAPIFRRTFRESERGVFNVLEALEKLPDIFPKCDFIIVEDKDLPVTNPARCKPNEKGGFTIEIRNEIYCGAFERKVGAYMDHICHELSHVFLFNIGYVPEFNRSLQKEKVKQCMSVEWQAMALTGETMIPYAETTGMGVEEIMRVYHVSKAAAKYRIKLD